jgi:hypothetical protein
MSIQDALTRSQPEGIGALREAMLAPIPFLLIELGLRRLRLGSSDCDGPESSICGPVDPNVPRSPPDRTLKRGATPSCSCRRLPVCVKALSPECLTRGFFEKYLGRPYL